VDLDRQVQHSGYHGYAFLRLGMSRFSCYSKRITYTAIYQSPDLNMFLKAENVQHLLGVSISLLPVPMLCVIVTALSNAFSSCYLS
jgi:hypothetical protein